ncbi:MAG TPA: heavy metal translocating P-type ATPase [Thermomicrobiales bacterium]
MKDHPAGPAILDPPPGDTPAEPVAGTSCRLTVTGMDCADCARTIESSLASLPGVRSASVNFARGTADVAYDPAVAGPPALIGRVKALGYGAHAAANGATAHDPWLFDVTGMDCGDCAMTVEQVVRRLPGVATATVNFGAATLGVTPTDGVLTPAAVVAAVTQAGYGAQARGEHHVAAPHVWWRQRRILEIAVAAALWVIGFTIEHLGAPRLASDVPFLLAMVIAGYPVARAGWYALKVRRADMNLLMTIAAAGAVLIGRWDEGASVLILFAIGVTLQNLTLERTRRAIQALVDLAPAEASVKRAGGEQRVPVATVAVGEIVVVRPGERLPVDGVVVGGTSGVDQAPITGESVPVAVEPGSDVFAGSINGDGMLEVRSTKPASDTTLAHIVHLVEEAQASKAPAQAFVDRFAAVYTPLVIAGAILLATVVPLIAGDFREWFFKALVLLVIACPCALVISTPVALVAAIGSASRRGVLFKGGAAIEALASVRTVAFDKTGTLTAGRPAVTGVVPLGGRSAEAVLARAAAVEGPATHPIALAIVRAAREGGVTVPPAVDAQGIPGRGASARIAGETVVVGSRRLFGAVPQEVERLLATAETDGKTAVLVGTAREVEAVIAVADPLRPVSRRAVATLGALGLRTVMLTGDNRQTAERIAAAAGVADVRAELLPEDKVDAVVDLQRSAPVAMVGDGVNDAPALATAAVGVAMGAAGTDVAIEAADVALMGDDLAQLPVAVRLARQTMSIIRQNITAALVVKAAFLALTLAGVTNLWLAVLADMGMSLAVTFNSLRLLHIERISHPDVHGAVGHIATQPAERAA